jgi:site-specific DNA-methyltransferase (adenine-specific)
MNTEFKNVESCFMQLDEHAMEEIEKKNKSYLEALIEGIDDGKIDLDTYPKEIRRRAVQLAILKGMKQEAVAGTGMTPDSVAMFMAYLAKTLVSRPASILDPAVGSGNLLTCLMNYYDHHLIGYGTEVEPLLVRLAYVSSNLQEHEVELFHQDGLKPLYIPQSELIVCDLPVGIYPNVEIAKGYDLYLEGEEVYTHHLLIEQCLRHASDDGFILLLIPNTLFTEPRADKLRQLINEKANILGLLQLPETLFQNGSIQKSIFILQKKGKHSKKPNQVLMASLPSFANKEKFSVALEQINSWINAEVK